ncbi:MAG: hypothetical protein AAF065_09230 [Verrucomicrobiota bacterium]
MKFFILPTLLLLATFSVLRAQEAITIDRVDFNSLRDDWIQVEIELSCNGNPSPEARDKRYVENIKVKAYLAYGEPGAFDFYTSEVEIIIMEQGDDNNVYFYLPGLIVERDQLSTDPDFYYVEVSVGDAAQQPQKAAMSSNIPNLESLNSFKSLANSSGSDNDHLLMPIYLVSGIDLGRVSNLPTFLRRDVRD